MVDGREKWSTVIVGALSERPSTWRALGERPYGGNPLGERPYGGNPLGERPYGEGRRNAGSRKRFWPDFCYNPFFICTCGLFEMSSGISHQQPSKSLAYSTAGLP